jgi:hypothetical protein
MGGIPPAWSDSVLVLVNFKHGKIACIDAGKAEARITRGLPERQGGQRGFGTLADAFLEDGAVRWQQDLGEAEGFEALSLAVAPNAVVAVVEGQDKFRAQPQWFLVALDLADGKQLFRQDLRAEPLPGGLLIDRAGRIVVRLLDGRVACYGPEG